MTVTNAIEILQLTFPDVDKTYLNLVLDVAQKDFVIRTEILEGYAKLGSLNSGTAWLLPTDFIRLLDVLFYDANGNPLYQKDLTIPLRWKVRNNPAGMGIHFYPIDGSNITSMPAQISEAYIKYAKMPQSVFTTSASKSVPFEVPETYHEGILANARAKLYRTTPIPSVAQDGTIVRTIFTNGILENTREFEYYVKLAIQTRNGKWKKGYDAIIYPDAGKYEMPKEPLEGISNSQVLSLLSTIQQ